MASASELQVGSKCFFSKFLSGCVAVFKIHAPPSVPDHEEARQTAMKQSKSRTFILGQLSKTEGYCDQ